MLSSFPVAAPPLLAVAPPLQCTPVSVSDAGVTARLLWTRRHLRFPPPRAVSPAIGRRPRRGRVPDCNSAVVALLSPVMTSFSF